MADAPLQRKYEEFAGGSAMAEAQPTETNRVAAPAAPGADQALLNLNTATQAEIELLPGIGPALAGRIIEQRQKLGAFKSLADLDAVSGIGPKMLEKIRPLVRFQ